MVITVFGQIARSDKKYITTAEQDILINRISGKTEISFSSGYLGHLNISSSMDGTYGAEITKIEIKSFCYK